MDDHRDKKYIIIYTLLYLNQNTQQQHKQQQSVQRRGGVNEEAKAQRSMLFVNN